MIEYNWYNEDGSAINTNGSNQLCTNEPGMYTVELIDLENGCTNSESFILEESSNVNITLDPQVSLTIDEDFVLNPEFNLELDQLIILWTGDSELSCDDCPNPTILNAQNGDIIEVLVTTEDGCEARATTLVVIDISVITKVYVPNIFTPGGTGFTLYASDEITEIEEVRIFDRWGELVYFNQNFEPNNPDIGWDGFFKGQPAEQGVYVYYFKYQNQGRTQITSGDITLIR